MSAVWYEILKDLRDYLRNYGILKIKSNTAKDATTTTFSNTTLTKYFKRGDTFTVSGDATVYTISADASTVSGDVTITFTPKAAMAWAADSAVTMGDNCELSVQCGAFDPDDNLSLQHGAIYLVRDREYNENIHNGGDGLMSFWAFCWVRSDTTEPLDGYKLLGELEDLFTAVFKEWVYNVAAATVGADVMNADIEETIGDADSHRPLLGSRKTIKLTWSKRTL